MYDNRKYTLSVQQSASNTSCGGTKELKNFLIPSITGQRETPLGQIAIKLCYQEYHEEYIELANRLIKFNNCIDSLSWTVTVPSYLAYQSGNEETAKISVQKW